MPPSLSQELASSIRVGLGKMNEAKDDVNKMKVELGVKNQELAVAQKDAEVLLKSISENTTIAEKEKAKVKVIVDAVVKKAAEIGAVKKDAEKDLAAAKPALDAAVSALNSISPKDIQGLKALKNPPDVIKRIFDTVLLLRYFPVDKVAWQDTKGAMVLCGTYSEAAKMMGDTNFLNALLNFPKASTRAACWPQNTAPRGRALRCDAGVLGGSSSCACGGRRSPPGRVLLHWFVVFQGCRYCRRSSSAAYVAAAACHQVNAVSAAVHIDAASSLSFPLPARRSKSTTRPSSCCSPTSPPRTLTSTRPRRRPATWPACVTGPTPCATTTLSPRSWTPRLRRCVRPRPS